MARTAAPSFWSRVCESAESALRRLLPLAAAAILTGLALPVPGRAADPVSGEAMFSNSGGYARLLLKFTEDVASEVTTAGSIIVIRFERPVNVSVERLPEGAPDYVSSARRDPDGMAIRLSLARRVSVNTMSAGERTFIDLLPDGWKARRRACRSKWCASLPSGRAPRSAPFASSAPRRRRRSARRSACAP